MGKILIGKPYKKVCGDKVRLCAELSWDNENFEFYYEVDNEYEKYLCAERATAFILSILEFALYKGYDIVSESPVDGDMYFALNQYGLKILSDGVAYYNRILIKAPVSYEKPESAGAVGTGFSAGVDSFHAVLSHHGNVDARHNLTHLLIANVGAFSYAKTEVTQKLFYKQVETLTPAANELGLPIIAVNTNSNDLYLKLDIPIDLMPSIPAGTPPKICGCVYALEKLFSIYYYASGVGLDKFEFHEGDPHFYLILWLKLFSTDSITFYGAGTEVTRMEKIEYIADNEVVQKYLSLDFGKNCSHCNKCMRTMAELYSINMLDKYSQVLDINSFIGHRNRSLGKYFAIKGEIRDGFVQEILRKCKENHIHIGAAVYLYRWLIYTPFYAVKDVLRKNKAIRRLYYKLNLDIKRNGETAKMWRSSYLPDMKDDSDE